MTDDNTPSGTVLLTGAAGRMGRTMRTELSQRFARVRLFSRSPIDQLGPSEEVALGDLSDRAAVQGACEGADVVIHLGGKADEAEFEEILSSNIVGTYNIFESAREAGVRRVVFASSHHVTGFYPVSHATRVDQPVRPDTYYGVSKVFGESLGRLYHDKWGLEVVCLRIGVCRPEPENSDQLRTWLSVDDSVQLVSAAAKNSVTEGFAIVYGVSGNSRCFWDSSTQAEIGFSPQHSADDFGHRFDTSAAYSVPWQGGAFTDADYVGGTW